MKSHLVCVVPLVSLWISCLSTSICAQSADPNHKVLVTYQSPTTVTISNSFAPFGARPDTDKIGDDGSAVVRDRNGVLIWSNSANDSELITNSGLARALYVSNTECVVYNNRYASDYNSWGSTTDLMIYRRATDGTITASPTISIPGTVLDTSPVTPNSNGFTLVGAVGFADGAESRQRYQSGSAGTPPYPLYAVRDVDVWDRITYQMYRLAWDGMLQSINFSTVSVPKTGTNLNATNVIGGGDDGSFVFTNVVAQDFYDDADDEDPGVFKTGQAALWATWNVNHENIRETVAVDGNVGELAYCSNRRLLLESQQFITPTGLYDILDYRMSAIGVSLLATPITTLPLGERVLTLSSYTRSGLPAYIYTIDDATATQLKLHRLDETLVPLGAPVTLPAGLIKGSNYVRNPRDASLLIKFDGASGVVWIPSNSATAPTTLSAPLSLPSSTLGLPMFVTSTEAIAWMNYEAPADLGLGGQVPVADIVHFNSSLTPTVLTPPIEGRYVALPSALTPDPDTEGWFVTTFEKDSVFVRSALIRSQRLVAASNTDLDSDGYLNESEMEFGSDPLVTISLPTLNSHIVIDPTIQALQIRFAAELGKSHTIQESSDLLEWTATETSLMGQGAVVSRSFSTASPLIRFFRVKKN